LSKFLRAIFTIAGTILGPALFVLVYDMLQTIQLVPYYTHWQPWFVITILGGTAVIFGIISFFISKQFVRWLLRMSNSIDRISPAVLLSGVLGLIVGLFIAFLLSMLVDKINVPWLAFALSVLLYVIFGVIGMRQGVKIAPRWKTIFKPAAKAKPAKETPVSAARPKILDTSVIIDGRIYDILKTGIIEGTIVIPQFVLGELRHIADSADSLKRAKGRRGLDILKHIQQELTLNVEVSAVDYEDIDEVDAKLLRMAEDMKGVVITNDFNLNKVAQVQGVKVFNINDLSNAVKPVFLPGEELTVTITREGKDPSQGVAYLDDGTMIVVENGRPLIGTSVKVTVTSVLQTSAGRMIFARA